LKGGPGVVFDCRSESRCAAWVLLHARSCALCHGWVRAHVCDMLQKGRRSYEVLFATGDPPTRMFWGRGDSLFLTLAGTSRSRATLLAF
jgi:hypothetical protein